MEQKGEVGGRLRDPALYLYVPSQSPTPPQISGRLSQLQGPGHNKWSLHTWSKAAAMPLPAFPDVESSYDDRQSPQALHSMLRTMWRGNPQGCLLETFLYPRVEPGQGKMPFGVPNCLLRSEPFTAEVQNSSRQLTSSQAMVAAPMLSWTHENRIKRKLVVQLACPLCH